MITAYVGVRVRRHDVVRLEVMRRDTFTSRVLLGTGGPRIEEVVDALEGATARATHLGVLVER